MKKQSSFMILKSFELPMIEHLNRFCMQVNDTVRLSSRSPNGLRVPTTLRHSSCSPTAGLVHLMLECESNDLKLFIQNCMLVLSTRLETLLSSIFPKHLLISRVP